MATIIQGPASDGEKQWIRSRIRRALDPRTFEVGAPGGLPSLIASDEPVDPFRDFQRRVGRATCDRWARGDRPGIIPYKDSYYRELCDPYLGDDAPGLPTTEPPFTGGQCAGVLYDTDITYRLYEPGCTFTTIGPETFADAIEGPVSLSFDNLGTGGNTSLLCPGVATTTIGLIANGVRQSQRGGIRGVELVSLSVTRRDGLPDTCGDVPSVFTPGQPNPTPDPNPGPVGGPTGYPFPDFNIDVSPDGDIIIDFGDGSPTEVFDPTEPVFDDGDGGPTGGPDVAPTSPGSPGGEQDTGEGGEASGCAPEGSELVGVLVFVSGTPSNPNKQFNTPFDTFRGAGYVSMGYEGLLGLDPTGAVIQSPQFFHAQQRGLQCWRVRANLGYQLETTPYYREIPE